MKGLFIDGKWSPTPARYAVPNPATEEIFAEAPDGTVADLKRAIAAARRAFDDGPWRRTTAGDRAQILSRIADGIETRKDEFRSLLIGAGGATQVSFVNQLDAPIEQLRACAQLATSFEFELKLPSVTQQTRSGKREIHSLAVRHPVGVCGLIPTWNFPLYVTLQKVGPALLAGCTMVVKPSPWGPLVDLLLAEVVDSCDLPPGVFNVVTGQDPALGAELCESALVDKVSFTGSVATGKKIMQSCAQTLKRVHLELGGKSALLILDDAELDEQIPAIASPAYFHAGQGCAMRTRVLVSRKRHDEVVAKMSGFVGKYIKVGNPADPQIMMGPLIREERRRAVEGFVTSGVEEGAKLIVGGKRPKDLAKGFFLEPTIFAEVKNDMRIAREEIFGPVVCVLPYENEADAIRMANDSRFGLAGGIVTKDIGRAVEIAKQIRTGGVSVNGASNSLVTPFGGMKESGIGREGGAFGVEEFTELQSISWPS